MRRVYDLLLKDAGFENPKGQLLHLSWVETEQRGTLMCMYRNFNKRYTLDSVFSVRGLHSRCVRWGCYHDNINCMMLDMDVCVRILLYNSKFVLSFY